MSIKEKNQSGWKSGPMNSHSQQTHATITFLCNPHASVVKLNLARPLLNALCLCIDYKWHH